MAKVKKKKKKENIYFKWGLTAFLSILAVIFVVLLIYNGKIFGDYLTRILDILMPIIDGFVVAYLLIPIINTLEGKVIGPFCEKRDIDISSVKRQKTIRVISIVITYTIVFLFIYAFFKTVVPQLIESIQSITRNMPIYLDSLIMYINKILEKLDLFEENDVYVIVETYYEDIVAFIQDNNIMPQISKWGKSLYSSVFSIVGALFNLIVGFIISIYLLASKEKFIGQGKKLIYSIMSKKRANGLINDIRFAHKTFGGFIIGKIVDSLIIGMLTFIILTIFNMPYTLLISVIIGVTNIIPFFGPFIGAIPSALLVLLIDPVKALTFIIIVIVIQQIDGNIIGPMILGNSTGLSGFWVIFAITLFGGLFGFIGMLLGVPVFACVYAFIKRNVRDNLDKKSLSQNTDDYINLKEITDNNTFLMNENTTDFNEGNLGGNGITLVEGKPKEDHFFIKAFGYIRNLIVKMWNKYKEKKQVSNDDTK